MGTEVKFDNINIIKPINKETVHKICSGQVVLSLAVAVKELVENSLDAGATNIEILFKNHGIDMIEVSDNGCGVTEDNFAALTLKYHTSKISDYSDLLGVSSFGFRGEALSSLCALANLTITTRNQNAEYATRIEYDHQGNITEQSPCSRQIGTTVSLTKLFHSLPVRQKEFHKNVKREFNKMTQLLYAYCLISLGVRITCKNQTSSSQTLVVATQGSNSFKDNIACVFGFKQLQSILEIKPEYVATIRDNIFKGLSGEFEQTEESLNLEDVEIDLSEDSNDAEAKESPSSSQKSQGYKNAVTPAEFTGFISSCAHGSGRSSTDRQFFYINNRPCEPTKIIKLINEIYKQYNPNQYPFVFLNISLERTFVDINVTPDKRKVFLTKEKIILDILKNSLLKLFESIPRTLKVETSLNPQSIVINESMKPNVDQPRIFKSFLQQFTNQIESKAKGEDETRSELKRKSSSMLDFISSKTKKTEKKIEINDSEDVKKCEVPVKEESSPHIEGNSCNEIGIGEHSDGNEKSNLPEEKKSNLDILYLDCGDQLPNTYIRNVADVIEEHTIHCQTKVMNSKAIASDYKGKASPCKNIKVVTDKEDLGKYNRKTVTLKTCFDHVKTLSKIYLNDKAKSKPTKVKFKSEINPVFNKKCEEELSREISKDCFKEMHVIGQFNLGFIITKLDEDLFIIDQHATDEIYNFETLQKTTELTSQKLQLELTGVNEQILMDNLDVFRKNGFTFEINEEAMPTKRVKLLTLPMSKNWVFGKEDIEELLFMLREAPSEYCRPSRVRAMFASRACRKSVMIGTALSKADMKQLVDHMAEIDKPWNCPHGRPTIRHLVNLAMVQTKE